MSSLKNKTIFLSRDKRKAISFIEQFDKIGAFVMAVPLISFQIFEHEENNERLKNLLNHDWIVFTSINGVEFFVETLKKFGMTVKDLKEIHHIRYAAVGTKTEEALVKHGLEVSFVPSVFDADHFSLQFLKHHHPKYPLLVKGNLARDVIDETLKGRSIPFETMFVYKTVINESVELKKLLNDQQIDYYCFTSPSSIDALIQLSHKDLKEEFDKPCFCIGETTEKRALQAGFINTIVPKEYTLDGLAAKIIECSERGII
ncbi:uroporphyrinogen-III synthase [Bacillaceae bacterium W0354]